MSLEEAEAEQQGKKPPTPRRPRATRRSRSIRASTTPPSSRNRKKTDEDVTDIIGDVEDEEEA